MSGKSILKRNTTKARKGNGYLRFIFQKEQVPDWIVLFLTVALGCFLVTRTYPYPMTSGDSFGYLWAALNDRFTYLRPFGYSFFLQIVAWFSRSIFSVIVSNALIYTLSLGLLTLAVKKYWPPRRKWSFLCLEAAAAFSPAAIFMLDTIMSDTLQTSLVFLMVAMLILMIQEESWWAMVVYVLALFASFHTRYSALFFPFAFLPVIALKGRPAFRITTILLTIAAFLVFHEQRTRNMTAQLAQRQFSTGFEGWQLANNALHVIPFIEMDEKVKVPEDEDVRELHRFVLRYELTNKSMIASTNNGTKATADFIWDYKSPLKQYLYRNKKGDDYSLNWIMLGSGLYKKYGKWLILHYPGRFIRYYLLQNVKEVFFTTKREMICKHDGGVIPTGKDEVVRWYNVPPDLDFGTRGNTYDRLFSPLMPWIELVTWLIFAASAVLLLTRKRLSRMPRETRLVLLMLFLFGFVYYGSITFASPIALRYWMPMHAIKLVFAWIAVVSSKILEPGHSES